MDQLNTVNTRLGISGYNARRHAGRRGELPPTPRFRDITARTRVTSIGAYLHPE